MSKFNDEQAQAEVIEKLEELKRMVQAAITTASISVCDGSYDVPFNTWISRSKVEHEPEPAMIIGDFVIYRVKK